MVLKGVKLVELVSDPLNVYGHRSGDPKDRTDPPGHTLVLEFDSGRKVTIRPSCYDDVVALVRAST